MMSDDELRSELSGLADNAEIATVSLESVQARGRRRTLYQRGGMVLAAFALVVGGTIAVTSVGDDGDDLDVAGDDTDAVATDDADDGSGEATEAREESPTTTVPDDDAATTEAADFAEAADIAFGGDYWGGPNRIVPWGDGFLAFGERFIEAEPNEMAFDGTSPIAEYFSQEILDTIEASGATTMQEASDVLSEAGLLEEATQVVMDNPEVMEWYSANAGGGTYEPFVEYSDDGLTWEPVEDFTWPGGQQWTPQFASNGTHLAAVVYNVEWDAETNRQIASDMTVHITTDLTTWSSTVVPVQRPDAPAYVNVETSPDQIALTDDGWFLTVSTWQWIDLWSALPQDVLDEMMENGWDWRPTEAGVEIVEWNWEEWEETIADYPTVAPDAAYPEAGAAEEAIAIEPDVWEEPEPTIIRTIPWSDLPFGYDDYMNAEFEGASNRQAFLGDLDGGVAAVDVPGDGNDGGQVIATDAGLFTVVYDYPEYAFTEHETSAEFDYSPTVQGFFSVDGRSWTEVALPNADGRNWIDSAVAVRDGILLTVSGESPGQRFFLGAADGTGFAEVDGPDLPENAWVWFPSYGTNADGVASIIDIGQSNQPQWVSYDVTFEHDGYEIRVTQDGTGGGTFTVTDGSGEVVFDHAGQVYDEPAFEYGDNGITIPDADGETILEIPFDVFEQVWNAESEAWDRAYNENPYVPEFRLVATTDGRSWTVIDLPAPNEEYGWYGEAIVNGDTVLVSDGMGNWGSYPLS